MPGWIIAEQMKTKNNMYLDLLRAHAIKKPKEFLYSHPEYKLSFLESIYLKYFLFLYKKGYSVAAITKYKEFYGLDFYVNKHVLIPRPDTELMVAEAIAEIKNDETILIDVGTGSGCIPISILKTSKHEPIKTLATDISHAALRVARKNTKIHNVKIKFLQGNLLEPVLKNYSPLLAPHSSIIITANLPYLREEQFQNEPSIQKEPKIALVAKNNGLALYEELLQQIKAADLNATIFLEIDPSQTEAITNIIKQYFPNSNVEIKKDLSSLDRLVKINY